MTSEFRPGDRVRVVRLWQLTNGLSKVGTLGVVKYCEGRVYDGYPVTLIEEANGRALWHRNCDLELTDLALLERAVTGLAHELIKHKSEEYFF